ncbi:hypothetical protein F4678DRAFT_257499 [Xylaria arbuscula]|nr:hypothetical protein F4678DRAFT_257499 [Xylaria arbuscula]
MPRLGFFPDPNISLPEDDNILSNGMFNQRHYVIPPHEKVGLDGLWEARRVHFLLLHHSRFLFRSYIRPVASWINTPGILEIVSRTAAVRGMTLEASNNNMGRGSLNKPSCIECDVCTLYVDIDGICYHCSICAGGNFDICGYCYESGASCLSISHMLVKGVPSDFV